jgi:hypothetical protein
MTSAEFGPFSGPKAKNATRWCCNCAPAVSALCPRLSASIVLAKVSLEEPLQRRLERLPYSLHMFLSIILFVLALLRVSDHTGDPAPRGLSASPSIHETNRVHILLNKYDRPLNHDKWGVQGHCSRSNSALYSNTSTVSPTESRLLRLWGARALRLRVKDSACALRSLKKRRKWSKSVSKHFNRYGRLVEQ